MLFSTFETSGSLAQKNKNKIKNFRKNQPVSQCRPKYVPMKIDIAINVYTYASSFECTAWKIKYSSSFG